MGLSRQDAISKYGTEAYTGWGENEAAQDAATKGRTGNSGGSSYNAQVWVNNQAIDDYVNELITQANGDYDFASKWIESTYLQALGNDDPSRADFLKQIANSLEKKVGTIAYDYNTNTYRKKQDMEISSGRTNEDRRIALEKLAADEQTYNRQNEQERQGTAENLNSRGLMSSTRQDAIGLAGKEFTNTEANISDRMNALQRAKDSTNLSADRLLSDTSLLGNRSLEDYTTSARRTALESQTTNDYQKELAKRQKEKTIANAKATGSAMKAGEANTYGSYFKPV